MNYDITHPRDLRAVLTSLNSPRRRSTHSSLMRRLTRRSSSGSSKTWNRRATGRRALRDGSGRELRLRRDQKSTAESAINGRSPLPQSLRTRPRWICSGHVTNTLTISLQPSARKARGP